MKIGAFFCPEKVGTILAPARRWGEDATFIIQHTPGDVKLYFCDLFTILGVDKRTEKADNIYSLKRKE